MTLVLYTLECSLTSFQQWDFLWYHFNNVHSFNRDISYKIYSLNMYWLSKTLTGVVELVSLASSQLMHVSHHSSSAQT